MNVMPAKPKILMVDDKPENLLVLERLLKDLPVELYRAASGNEALRLTLHNDFALALLDIQMPEMDGYELAELLRQEERTAKMPFIFISAIYTDHINIFQGYERGAFSYIVKPFEPGILLNKVRLFIEMHEHEQALQRRTLELERANRELESFSYSVSHDLRAPLRAISGFSHVLAEDYAAKLDDQGRVLLDKVSSAAKRMGFLIDDLLNLSRVARCEMQITTVDLSGLALEAVAEIRSHFAGQEGTVTVQPGLETRGDQRLLRVVFDNLLGNAWKFSREVAHPSIEVGALTEGASEAAYYVRDNGVGFDMQYADKLFIPFQRLHEARRFPGTGIGLATVQRIIVKHGGEIWAESAPGQGTTFYFTLRTGGREGA